MTDRNIDRKTEKTERLRQIQKHIYRGRDRERETGRKRYRETKKAWESQRKALERQRDVEERYR